MGVDPRALQLLQEMHKHTNRSELSELHELVHQIWTLLTGKYIHDDY